MKKFLLVIVFLITNYSYVYSDSNVNPIIEGNVDAKIHLIIYLEMLKITTQAKEITLI